MSEGQNMEERRWQEAIAALRLRSLPTAAETDRFLRSVMVKLEEKPQPWQSAVVGWARSRWMAPALGLGLAAALLSIRLQGADVIAPLDLLIMLDPASSSVAEMVLPHDSTEDL